MSWQRSSKVAIRPQSVHEAAAPAHSPNIVAALHRQVEALSAGEPQEGADTRGDSEVQLDEKDLKKVFWIGTTLGTKHETMLIQVLREYWDIFASISEARGRGCLAALPDCFGVSSKQRSHTGGGEARKLKPYFEAQQVEVITDQSLRQILENPRRSGRIVKWPIELSELDLRYKAWTSIKAQALADFVVECTHGPTDEALGLVKLVEATEQRPPGTTWPVKLESPWEGSYLVRRVVGPVTYELETLDGRQVPRSLNACHLRKYYV
ncbi:hypothetical protein LIER_04927 [Lithospermum erythrorhizon]|uniref:Uncharacterized protein n=1 Tax=Lithospermum erythrorhizon TaxID=34254 RepID=A0AAV3NYU4_LITER